MATDTKQMLLISGLMAALILPASLHAQTAAAPPPSDSAMVNLVRALVAEKVLTPEKGQALIAQALSEAETARKGEAAQLAAAPAASTPDAANLPPPAPGAVRVPYVPDAVREAIKDDLRREVMAQAKSEGWAASGEAAPDWTRRITISGDFRYRYESDLYSASNSNQILNYALINQNGPYNIAGTVLPYLDTRDDHLDLMKLRARLNIGVKVADGVDANFMIATGDNSSPISTNALLAGGFEKRSLWMQQAWLRLSPWQGTSLTIGRMPDPFLHTELVFENELAFDGILAQTTRDHVFGTGVGVTLRAGAFPLDFGDPNYLSTNSIKTNDPQKWLFAGQAEFNDQLTRKLSLKMSAAYYYFLNTQEQLSAPCFTGDGQTQCSTDGTVPDFMTKGNTLSYVRQLATVNGQQLTALPQYFAPTFKFHVVNVNGILSHDLGHDRSVDLVGDYIRNIGFKKSDICRNGVYGEPFNNGGSEGGTASICDTTGDVPTTKWVGGRDGWQALVRVGDRDPHHWGQWSLDAAYRHIDSDAILDAFPDADMHLGGTNYKGYILGATAGIFDNMSISAHWYSANQITAEPFAIDVLEVDLNARF